MNPDNNQPNDGSTPVPIDQNADGIIHPTETADGTKFFQPTVHNDFQQPTDMGSGAQNQPQNPNQGMGIQVDEKLNKPKKPKMLFIVLGVVGVLIVITIVAVVLAGSGKKKPAKNTTDTSQEDVGPQPAEAIDVEQSNNSINQDISTLSDQKDFPENQIDDKSLGL